LFNFFNLIPILSFLENKIPEHLHLWWYCNVAHSRPLYVDVILYNDAHSRPLYVDVILYNDTHSRLVYVVVILYIIMLSVNFFCNISSYDILAYITKNYIALIYYAKIVHLLCQFHAGKVRFSAVCQAIYS
jgi:hypothetical protein